MPDVFVLPPKPRNPQGRIRDAEDLGEAMVGINEQEIQLLMAERVK